MLGNYFRELLEKHNRVIIPDFGAFLVKDTGDDRSINNTSFSPFLRYNDGLVEAFLSEKEGLTKADATLKVKEYVDSLKLQLEKGAQVELPKLGYFYQDARGNVQFQLELTNSTSVIKENRKNTVDIVDAKSVVVSRPEEKEETKPVINTEASAVTPAKFEEVKKPEPSAAEEPKQPTKTPIKPIPTVKKGKVTPIPPKQKEELKPQKSESIHTTMAKPTNKKSTNSKGRKGYWLLITGLIVMLLLVIWQYDTIVSIFSSTQQSKAIVDTFKSADSTTALIAKANRDTVTVTSELPGPKYVKPIIDIPENIFLVVVGSFTIKENATNQLKKLTEQGYQPIIIVRKNEIYSVVISGHKTKDEAKLSLQGYMKKNGEGWILSR